VSEPTSAVPASAPARVVRGPTSLDFDPAGNGDPISLLWHEPSATLYIADNRNDQIWTWTDAAGFTKLVALPSDPAAVDAGQTNLGQIVRLPDGTLVVPRFGFGKTGAIVHVDPASKNGAAIAGLSRELRRVALTAQGDVLWGAYFQQGQQSDGAGTVTKITGLKEEQSYATGFQKPVAVIVHEGKLIVSDQARGVLYALPLSGAAPPYPVYARVASPDALAEGPNGSLITGQYKRLNDGGPLQIRQVMPDGTVKVIATSDLARPQGVAYDTRNKRLFVADSNGTTVRTIKIFPLE
jgi:hypothetical protein